MNQTQAGFYQPESWRRPSISRRFGWILKPNALDLYLLKAPV